MLVYMVAAVRPLGSELQLIPCWTISVTEHVPVPDAPPLPAETALIPFKLGQNMGYFTPDGTVAVLESFPFKAAISPVYRAAYGPDAVNIPFYTPDRLEPAAVIGGSGFPFFDEERIFLFMPGGASLAQYDASGAKKWQFEGYVPIVAFASSAAGCAAGYADGTVIVFDADGTVKQTFVPGGSDYPIILGVDITESGTQIACVSGIDRQRFVLTQEKDGISKIVFHTYLNGNMRSPALVRFNKAGSTVFYACTDGLGIVDCATFKNKIIALPGTILAVEETQIPGVVCVLAKEKSTYSVYIVEQFGNLIGHFSFTADYAFIDTDADSLYVGRNDTISRIRLERK